ncbi:MAG: thermonuclease family protein [Candidatus Omnitrophica bacterium]|nr:thermonuclease family protein [Candidatus Omnitrophota bacterium]
MKTKKITVVKNRLPANLPNVKTYAALRARVRKILALGWLRIKEIKLTMDWETGRSLYAHVYQNGGRAAYGKEVILKLAHDLGISDDVLYKAKHIYEAYPISAPARKLTARHYDALARISNKKKRLELEVRAEKDGWTTNELEKKVRAMVKPPIKAGSNGKAVSKLNLLEPKKGRIGIFQIVDKRGGLNIDLGFTAYVALPDKSGNGKKNLKAGDFIRFSAGKIEKVKDAKTADLFTYEAELVRVIDADTYWMKIWLEKPHWLEEKLRLRGLDAPELNTVAGRRAKRSVEALFKKAVAVTITTTKPDKWDRYLSDVFLKMKDAKEIFLNNLLLEKGFAVRKDKFSLLDWEK